MLRTSPRLRRATALGASAALISSGLVAAGLLTAVPASAGTAPVPRGSCGSGGGEWGASIGDPLDVGDGVCQIVYAATDAAGAPVDGASFTFTPPVGVTQVDVLLGGGGGGGGGGASDGTSFLAGGGGAGGSLAVYRDVTVSHDSPVSVTVGAGGAGGTAGATAGASGSNGTAGASSFFGIEEATGTVYALGGGGGKGANGTTNAAGDGGSTPANPTADFSAPTTTTSGGAAATTRLTGDTNVWHTAGGGGASPAGNGVDGVVSGAMDQIQDGTGAHTVVGGDGAASSQIEPTAGLFTGSWQSSLGSFWGDAFYAASNGPGFAPGGGGAASGIDYCDDDTICDRSGAGGDNQLGQGVYTHSTMGYDPYDPNCGCDPEHWYPVPDGIKAWSYPNSYAFGSGGGAGMTMTGLLENDDDSNGDAGTAGIVVVRYLAPPLPDCTATDSEPSPGLHEVVLDGTCAWTVPEGVETIDVLAVGGGGGGGAAGDVGAGGGAGGQVISCPAITVAGGDVLGSFTGSGGVGGDYDAERYADSGGSTSLSLYDGSGWTTPCEAYGGSSGNGTWAESGQSGNGGISSDWQWYAAAYDDAGAGLHAGGGGSSDATGTDGYAPDVVCTTTCISDGADGVTVADRVTGQTTLFSGDTRIFGGGGGGGNTAPGSAAGGAGGGGTGGIVGTSVDGGAGTALGAGGGGGVYDGDAHGKGGAGHDGALIIRWSTSTPITVTAAADTKSYDGTTSSAGIPTTTGLKPGHVLDPTTCTQSFDSATVGATKTLTVNPSCLVHDGSGNDVTSQYTVSFATATGVIEAATMTCKVKPYSVTFDGKPHTATATCTGLGGASITGLTVSGTTHTNAGSYTDTASVTEPSGNYAAATATITDVIGQVVPTIAYSGTQWVATSGTSMAPSASGLPAICTGSITYSLDVNPLTGAAGPYTLTVSSGKVTTTGWLPGAYLITASYAGDGNCAAALDISGLTVGLTSPGSAWGGGYNNYSPGRGNFGFEVQSFAKTSTTPAYVKGQLAWVLKNTWKFKGTLTSYSVSNGVGTAKGTGNLFYWSKTATGGNWVAATTGSATVTITFTQTTASTKTKAGTVGSFGISYGGTKVAGSPALPSYPIGNISDGNIKMN